MHKNMLQKQQARGLFAQIHYIGIPKPFLLILYAQMEFVFAQNQIIVRTNKIRVRTKYKKNVIFL